jgi:6-phosphogluconolactonase
MTLSRLLVAAAMVAAPFAQAAEPSAYHVYFGCNTPKGSTSKGIYRAEFDPKTGKLTQPELAAEVGNPSFLHIAPDGKTLYSVGEASGKDGGGVYSFKLDPATGKLSDRVSLTSGSSGPCHISTDDKNTMAVVSNYGGGSFAFFTLKPDGSLDKRIGHEVMPLLKVNDKDKKANGHSGFFDNSGTLIFCCNLGHDRVQIFKKTAPEKVEPNDPPFIAMPAGSGPRHLHLTKDNDFAFVNGELDMTVSVVKLDTKANKYEVIQTLSTLRDREKPAKGLSTAECRIHPNGKFVYVSNRGHNTIAVFEWDNAAKKLTAKGHITGDIKTPRNFNITPDGKWMLIASQSGGKVGVWEIDQATGLANETGNTAKIDDCVCVKFLAKP